MGIIRDIFIQFKIIHANVSNVLCAQSAVTRTCDLLDPGLTADCRLGTPTPALLQQSLNNSFCPFTEPEHKIIYIIISLLLHPLKNTGYF